MATISYARTDTTTQAQAAIDCVEDALTRHGGYTKVATIFSATSQPCSVWRCSGTRNSLGRDFYFMIGRPIPTSPPSFSVAISEGFDQGNRTLIRPAPGLLGKSAAPAEDFSYGGGLGFPIWNADKLNTDDIEWHTISIGQNRVDIWAIVTNDTIAITRSTVGSDGGSVIMAGVAEPFRADDPGIVYINSSSSDGAVTRHPTIVAPDPYNWMIARLNNANCIWTQRSGQLGAEGDRLHDSRPVGSRILVRHMGAVQKTGALRGLYHNILNINTVSQTYMAGEKLFVGSDVYQYPGDASGMWLNTGPT